MIRNWIDKECTKGGVYKGIYDKGCACMHMIEESMKCVCVQGFHTFTLLCVGAVVCQSSHRVLTSGIHAVRGLQGGRCGMDVLQWVCNMLLMTKNTCHMFLMLAGEHNTSQSQRPSATSPKTSNAQGC